VDDLLLQGFLRRVNLAFENGSVVVTMSVNSSFLNKGVGVSRIVPGCRSVRASCQWWIGWVCPSIFQTRSEEKGRKGAMVTVSAWTRRRADMQHGLCSVSGLF